MFLIKIPGFVTEKRVENIQVLTAAECPKGRQNYLVLSVETRGEWLS